MRIAKVSINNFRGIKSGEFLLPKYGVLVGDNNIGKSTVLEAIDLVLGPDRMRKKPVIDEHDFFSGDYLNLEKKPIEINIKITIVDLNDEQETHFKDHIEWWDDSNKTTLNSPPPESTDNDNILSAISFIFLGKYDEEEDDFIGNTYFYSPLNENGKRSPFTTRDKRRCGFLFLRTLRTGSRALSLERGSLLDVILNLSDIKLNMWESVLNKLRTTSVAENPDLEIVNLLSNINSSLKNLVPSNWGTESQMKVSDLTREHLRKTLNVFMKTGVKNLKGDCHIAPFKKQGTGTINMLVLSMLSIVAELKKNVIFAMEEPEIAIPPYTQKRIVNRIKEKSIQAIFTSHSPYILEEFKPKEIVVLTKDVNGNSSIQSSFPRSVKPQNYRTEFRKKYCEALLSKKVLIVEGKTEYDVIPSVARYLHALDSRKFSPLEGLGIAIINAETDSQITPIATHLNKMGKITMAIYDKQQETQGKLIRESVSYPFESSEKGFEKLIIENTSFDKIKKFAIDLVGENSWPDHLSSLMPNVNNTEQEIKKALYEYLVWSKGLDTISDLLKTCQINEIPKFITESLEEIKALVEKEI